MKKIILFLILAVAVILGVLVYQAAPTVDMNAELEKTVDDGGQADFDSLTQDASGL